MSKKYPMKQTFPKGYSGSSELDNLREEFENDTRLVSLLLERLDELWLDHEKEMECKYQFARFIELQGEDMVKQFIEHIYTEEKDSVFEIDGEPIPPHVVQIFGDRFDLSEFPPTKADFPKSTLC